MIEENKKQILIGLSNASNKHLVPALNEIKCKTAFDAEEVLEHTYKEVFIPTASLGYGGIYITLNTTLGDKGRQSIDYYRYDYKIIIKLLKPLYGYDVIIHPELSKGKSSSSVVEVVWNKSRVSLLDCSEVLLKSSSRSNFSSKESPYIYTVTVPPDMINDEVSYIFR